MENTQTGEFKFELHCHTAEGSGCSVMSAHEMVDFYVERGYDGIVVSDHFTGKTTVPKGSTWNERIEYFYENGFAKAYRYGQERGLKVFFGPEWSSEGNDFLLLGLDKDWWLRQTDFFELSPGEVFDRVHEAGGIVIHAHPFAQAKWIKCIRLFPDKTDAVEVFNGGSCDTVNERALAYARSYGLKMTGGTDIHNSNVKVLCGITVPYACSTVAELVSAIKSGDARPFCEKQ
ncbi:MAG: PHP domain-containing protein [Eubacteriales bacterium]